VAGESEELAATVGEAPPPPPPEPAPQKVTVHYRERKSAAPLCDATLKGRPGHVMGRTWDDLAGDDGRPLNSPSGRRACTDCLKARAYKAAAKPAEEDPDAELQADPGMLKAQLRTYGPRGAAVLMHRIGRPPLSYIEARGAVPSGEDMLGNATDSIVDVLDYYDLLGPAMTSPAISAIINVFGLLAAVRSLPVLEGAALRRAHGIVDVEPAPPEPKEDP
jgi:hypothetical protein